MQSLFQTGQLDLTQISGLLTNVLVTGQVLRPLETVPFLTDDYLESTGNFINTYNVNLSGSIVETGQFILNEYLTGGLAGTLNLTGQSLLARDNLLSGTFNLSGRILSNLLTDFSNSFRSESFAYTQTLTGLSGAFNVTGLNLVKLLTGLSGQFNQTGQDLLFRIRGGSGISQTGISIIKTLTGLSGAFNQTGLYIFNIQTGISGAFNQTGRNLHNLLTGMSGVFNQTMLEIFNIETGMSGAFNQTGRNLHNLLTGLSGAFNITGLNLINDLTGLKENSLNITGRSGDINLIGLGDVNITAGGQTVTINFPHPDIGPGRIISINGQTGDLIITGVGDIQILRQGDQTLIVSGLTGADLVLQQERHRFAVLNESFYFYTDVDDANLAYITNLLSLTSGTVRNKIAESGLGVLSVNFLTHDFLISGQNNIFVSTGEQSIIISGSGDRTLWPFNLELPHWIEKHADVTFTPNSFDDDFTGLYLDPKWTGININVDESGIKNSHFYMYGKAAASDLHIMLQGITTGAEWETSLKCDILPPFNNFTAFGLIFRNATNKKAVTYGYSYNTSYSPDDGLIGEEYLDSALFGTRFVSGDRTDFKNLHLRVQLRTGAFHCQTSSDGIIWKQVRQFPQTWVNHIDQVGFYMRSQGAQMIGAVDWWRATGLS